MGSGNVVQEKSYAFSLRIIKLYLHLKTKQHEYVLSKQVLKSGTAIGANIEEAIGGQSRKDFISKMSISYKEARETHYWIRLLKDTELLEHNMAVSLLNDCEELLKLLSSILTSAKTNS